MRSHTTPEFWKAYSELDSNLKKSARKAFTIWLARPFHPSLRFKCVNSKENIWSARISKGYRALCVIENDTAIWFWIGNHDAYEKFFG